MSPAKPSEAGSVRNCGSTSVCKRPFFRNRSSSVDRLLLVPMGVIQARFDAAEEVADAGTCKVLPQRQIAGRQRFLDVRRFDVAFGPVSAPAARSPSETWLASA